jgi:cbb3-type cytochrome oxidase maturation protein
MDILVWLIPITLAMGAVGLFAFMWSTRAGQYDDLDGAAERVLLAQRIDRPIVERPPAPETDGVAGRSARAGSDRDSANGKQHASIP